MVQEVSGRASANAAEPALVADATGAASVSALPGDGQARGLPLGPYWIHTPASGEHQILAKYGQIIFRYPPDQLRIADAHLSRLQYSYSRQLAMKREAAEDMYDALEAFVSLMAVREAELGALSDEMTAVVQRARGAISAAQAQS